MENSKDLDVNFIDISLDDSRDIDLLEASIFDEIARKNDLGKNEESEIKDYNIYHSKNANIKLPLLCKKQRKTLFRRSNSKRKEVRSKRKMDVNNLNSKKIDKPIGEFIALQNLPFYSVEGLGFRRLIHELAPRYNFRGRNFFTDFVCNELYGKVV
ncbi:unnamed protein product [Parnassius apollo]|uniref:(apollo) hypothetical protein n=1 Tax=Parnassius apollo TaxID=110799 RepID=A0A8S3WN53_PARAO|nr:unnamed protein product [Parnassius apollo]